MHLTRNTKIGLLGALVSAVALLFIITQINLTLFLTALQTAQYAYLLPCMLLLLMGLFTRAQRWRVLLNERGHYWRVFHIMNVAYLVNGVLPLRMGEVARVYLMTRLEPPTPIFKTTSTIILERLLDLLAVVVLMLLALAVGPVPQELQQAGFVGLVMSLAGFTVMMGLAHNRSPLNRALAYLTERVQLLQRFNVQAWLNQFLDGIQPMTHPHILLRAVGWTALSWALSVMAGYVLMYAFFEIASWSATALYIAAAAFAIALPAIPGNIGTYEGSILLALTAMGYAMNEQALAFAITVHAVNVFVHASTGMIGLLQEGITVAGLIDGVRQQQTKVTS